MTYEQQSLVDDLRAHLKERRRLQRHGGSTEEWAQLKRSDLRIQRQWRRRFPGDWDGRLEITTHQVEAELAKEHNMTEAK